MRYALLVYSDQSSWAELSDEEQARQREESMPGWNALFGELVAADPNVVGKELEEATAAKTVRVVDGEVLVTDGPFPETKEQIGGILILEARDLNHAIQLISKHPGVRGGPFEIRPVVDMSGMLAESERRRSRSKPPQAS